MVEGNHQRPAVLTGGCQCGAVRYALYAKPDGASLCHCRMCQKAVGNAFAAYAGVPRADLAWTRGAPATFNSSPVAERGFCARCGTPLTFRYLDADRISVTLGSLDDPEAVRPTVHDGVEGRLGWLRMADGLPEARTETDQPPERLARIVSLQHPDHDTPEGWTPPPAGGAS
ncbi:MAG TPA: GFA family protein [Geminicoccaceae bacterium]|nr:GFA family protein [Geminicoccaceae bacterium]